MAHIDITESLPIDMTGLGEAAVSPVNYAPPSVRWDCSIGGLPFLFGMSDQFPMQRETADFRRQRIDNERDPGEQSLDSGYWIRSQSSWHYGTGLVSAEPLEVNLEEARFRYATGGGVDPWTPGKLTLLHDTARVYESSGASQHLLGVDTGVLHCTGSTMKYIQSDGAANTVTWGGTAGDILSVTSNGQKWIVSDDDGYYMGTIPSPSSTNPSGSGKIFETTLANNDRTLVRWVKSRVFAAENHIVWWFSLPSTVPGTAPKITTTTKVFEHPTTSWIWTDFAESPEAIYMSGYTGDTSHIYKATVSDTGAVTSLTAGAVVTEMPRGEIILSMYAYLGSYLAIGTNKGLRIASINTGGSLSLGPLVHETTDGVYDMVAVGNYMWFTVGSKGNAGNRVYRAGIYRIDLGQNINDHVLDFAHAADLVVPAAYTTGEARQVTVSGGKLWFSVNTVGVFKEQDTYVSDGWFESGRVRLGTLEAKAWRDMRLIGTLGMSGIITAYASKTDSNAPSTWPQIIQANGQYPDNYGLLNTYSSTPQANLYAAFRLHTDDVTKTPVFIGYQIRALPAPNRSRLIRVPVMVYDYEIDRTGLRYGQRGGAYERMGKLEDLESTASTVTYVDYTTGERSEAYIERLSYNRVTPPTRNQSGNGGILNITLRLL